jgi:hypothetical protein
VPRLLVVPAVSGQFSRITALTRRTRIMRRRSLAATRAKGTTPLARVPEQPGPDPSGGDGLGVGTGRAYGHHLQRPTAMTNDTRPGLRVGSFRIAHSGHLSRLRDGVRQWLQSLSKARRVLANPWAATPTLGAQSIGRVPPTNARRAPDCVVPDHDPVTDCMTRGRKRDIPVCDISGRLSVNQETSGFRKRK